MIRRIPHFNAFILSLLLMGSLAFMGCEPQEKSNSSRGPAANTDSMPLQPETAEVAEEETELAFPEELRPTIPAGFELVEGEEGPVWSVGDLNGDGLADAGMLVRKTDDFDNHSAVVVSLGKQGGGYSFKESTENLGPEPLQYTDPDFVYIEEGYLYIAFQSMRWGIDLVFEWMPETQEMILVSSETLSSGNEFGDGAGTARTDYVKGSRISAYQRWNEKLGRSIMETPKTISVPKVLHPLKDLNDDLIYELQ